MNRYLRLVFAASMLVFPVTLPALAADPAPQAMNARDQADIRRIEDYLNAIKTIKAKFIQVAPNGREVTGTFYLSRPGKMRLEYDPPIKDFIVADGWFIFYWDGEMKQQSSEPIGSSLADFILRDNIRFSGDVRVKEIQRFPAAIEVTLVESDEPGKGQITLVFEDKPLQLRQWRVTDADGQTTRVGLLDAEEGLPLDGKLFSFIPPK